LQNLFHSKDTAVKLCFQAVCFTAFCSVITLSGDSEAMGGSYPAIFSSWLPHFESGNLDV